MIFFTSDLHFGHKNIINACNRPWNSIESMDKNLIANINHIVDTKDTLYILGDFCLNKGYDTCMKYREQINCQDIHLILGNHDRRFIENGQKSPFSSEQDYLEIKHNGCLFCLSHYPFLSWRNKERGSIMCHGHVHSKSVENLRNYYNGDRRYDVGVDANSYKPVSIEDISSFLAD